MAKELPLTEYEQNNFTIFFLTLFFSLFITLTSTVFSFFLKHFLFAGGSRISSKKYIYSVQLSNGWY